jgi:hypothetical protein
VCDSDHNILLSVGFCCVLIDEQGALAVHAVQS